MKSSSRKESVMADRKELQATAEEAIGLAKQMCGVDLDYSLGSIGTLDAVLGTCLLYTSRCV